jgi:hypothetical protein
MEQMMDRLLAKMEGDQEKMEPMIKTVQEQMTAKIKTDQEEMKAH